MAKVLVVDDEPIIAMTVGDWLTDLGHDVVGPATDLGAALALCEHQVHAAVLDVSLGARTTEEIAARLSARGVPFAVASGHDADSLGAAFSHGVALPKPFGFETFRLTMEQLLAKSSALRPD